MIEKEIFTQFFFSLWFNIQLNHRFLTTTPHKDSVLQKNSENHKTPVFIRVAFVFLEKLSLEGTSFLPQIKTQTMLQKEQILLPALYRQSESAQGFNTSSGLNYLVLLTETTLLSFLYSLGNNHTNDRGS